MGGCSQLLRTQMVTHRVQLAANYTGTELLRGVQTRHTADVHACRSLLCHWSCRVSGRLATRIPLFTDLAGYLRHVLSVLAVSADHLIWKYVQKDRAFDESCLSSGSCVSFIPSRASTLTAPNGDVFSALTGAAVSLRSAPLSRSASALCADAGQLRACLRSLPIVGR